MQGLAGLLLLVLPTLVFAQSAANCPPIVLAVDVRDDGGKFVNGLSTANFSASFRDNSVEIQSTQSNVAAPRVLLLLDASGSMTANPSKWHHALSIATNIANSPAPIHLGLVVFAGDVADSLDFTHSRQDVLEHLQKVEEKPPTPTNARSQTALWDSLLRALSAFGNPEPGDSVLVITDGGDNKSEATMKAVKRSVLEKHTRIFAYVLTERSPRTEEEIYGASYLDELAEATGGIAIQTKGLIKNAADEAPITGLFDSVFHFYALQLALPDSVAKGSMKIRVSDISGDKHRKLLLRYQRDLLTCHE